MLRSLFILPLIALLAAPAPGRAATAEDGQQFRDWTLRCEESERGETGCYMFQNLLLKSEDKRLLHVAVGFLDEGGAQRQAAALFTLPLGVSLPGGLSLAVDDGTPIRMRYERCHANGCLAPLVLTDDLIRALKGGRWARVVFFDATRREVSVPVSLLGFTAGFNALQP